MPNFNRRSIFGLFAGGAVAGPKLAEGILADASLSPNALPLGGYAGETAAGNPLLRNAQRISWLTKAVSGQISEDERERENARRLNRQSLPDRLRIEGLRSVSPQHKARMLMEAEYNRMREAQKIDFGVSLRRLLAGKDEYGDD